MKNSEKTVDEYLAGLAAPLQTDLMALRAMIRRVAPEAVESMAYAMPTYLLGAKQEMLCAFNAQKNYVSFYLCGPDAADVVRERLPKLKIGKGCVRFRSLAQAPLEILELGLRQAQRMG